MSIPKSYKTFATEQEGYHYISIFAQREGHSMVPTSHLEDNFKLGLWVQRCRTAHKQNKLSQKLKQALESLPRWCWNAHDAKWMQKFELLKKFVKREGHALVPQFHVEFGEKLGSWVATQKSRKDSLTEQRFKLLESLPGWVWKLSDSKNERIIERQVQNPPVEQEEPTDFYEMLAQRSTRSFDGYEDPRLLPKIKIPGELVFFLDDLVEYAVNELKMSPNDALADVIDHGIETWYKTHMGLPPKKEIRHQVSPEAIPESVSLEVEVLKKELDKIKTQRDRLKLQLEDLHSEIVSKEKVPQRAQQNAYPDENANTYTPLTNHGNSGPNRRSRRFG